MEKKKNHRTPNTLGCIGDFALILYFVQRNVRKTNEKQPNFLCCSLMALTNWFFHILTISYRMKLWFKFNSLGHTASNVTSKFGYRVVCPNPTLTFKLNVIETVLFIVIFHLVKNFYSFSNSLIHSHPFRIFSWHHFICTIYQTTQKPLFDDVLDSFVLEIFQDSGVVCAVRKAKSHSNIIQNVQIRTKLKDNEEIEWPIFGFGTPFCGHRPKEQWQHVVDQFNNDEKTNTRKMYHLNVFLFRLFPLPMIFLFVCILIFNIIQFKMFVKPPTHSIFPLNLCFIFVSCFINCIKQSRTPFRGAEEIHIYTNNVFVVLFLI